MRRKLWSGMVVGAIAACSSAAGPPAPPSGVIYTFPADGQLDVPLGTRIVVTFSEPVIASAIAACSGTAAQPIGALCLVGPDGPVAANATVVGDGRIVQLTAALAEGTTYAVYARTELAPAAGNLPASGPLVRFTTRSTRPRTAATTLLAVNGGAPGQPEPFRPMFESSTIRLVFSQPLDPRSVALAPGRIELRDPAGAAVPARLLSDGIHVSIDPVDDLVAGQDYKLEVGSDLIDLAGRPVTPAEVMLTPQRTAPEHPIPQILRTRAAGDHGSASPHVDATRNAIAIDSPLIGASSIAIQPGALAIELGDPALGGPLAFTIRRGQRLRAGGLAVKLGGVLPAGLATGDILIELLSDGGGRIYRNPHQSPDLRPDNDRSPLIADLSLDLAIYAVDPEGNAVLTQTVLGVQGSGVVIADDGVLDIEAALAIDLDLLGLATTTTNLALELITAPMATVDADHAPLMLVAALPGATAAPASPDTAIELVFTEPIDLERARAGGIRLETDAGERVRIAIESHGAALAIHPCPDSSTDSELPCMPTPSGNPLSPLAPGTTYRVVLGDVADLAGNPLPATAAPSFTTPPQIATTTPATLASVHPGAPCALTGGSATTPGHCLTSTTAGDDYHPFSLAANDAIDVRFTQPLAPASVTRGTACNTGSIRIEAIDASGGCVAPVAGTLRLRARAVSFVPDQPWQIGKHYRLTLISGPDAGCDTGEICGTNGVAVYLSPLDRAVPHVAVRANLVIDFTGGAATTATLATMETVPISDVNGSGAIESGEPASDDNRVALRITGTSGVISAASFPVTDCIAATPEVEACSALSAALPVALLPAAHDCRVPGEQDTLASCVPVALSPQQVIGTSLPLNATLNTGQTLGNNDTHDLVMRLREPPDGPAMGYIIDDHGTPIFVATLDLYLDAPDLQIALIDHDLHAKPLSIAVRGPLRFLPDGRIAIAVANVADVPIDVNLLQLGTTVGAVHMLMPLGGLKLQLVSPPLRGGAR
jgi:Big-like domain-containing protein